MYRLDPNPTFWATVTVRSPDGDSELGTVRARFRALTISAFEAFDLATPEGTRGLLVAALADLDDIEGEDGKPVAFSPAVRDQLLDVNHVRQALLASYIATLGGARSGN